MKKLEGYSNRWMGLEGQVDGKPKLMGYYTSNGWMDMHVQMGKLERYSKGWMNGREIGGIYPWMDGCMHVQMDGLMGVCMHGWMDGCMHV